MFGVFEIVLGCVLRKLERRQSGCDFSEERLVLSFFVFVLFSVFVVFVFVFLCVLVRRQSGLGRVGWSRSGTGRLGK